MVLILGVNRKLHADSAAGYSKVSVSNTATLSRNSAFEVAYWAVWIHEHVHTMQTGYWTHNDESLLYLMHPNSSKGEAVLYNTRDVLEDRPYFDY